MNLLRFANAFVLSAATTTAFCTTAAFAAPPQFAGKLSARQSAFNDFIRRNANKEVYLSVVFDPVSGGKNARKVEEPNDIGSPHPKIPSFSVDDHFYLLDNAGNTEDWKKRTRYDATARQLKGTFLIAFDESFKDYKGAVSRIYRLRFLPGRANAVNNGTAGRPSGELPMSSRWCQASVSDASSWGIAGKSFTAV